MQEKQKQKQGLHCPVLKMMSDLILTFFTHFSYDLVFHRIIIS